MPTRMIGDLAVSAIGMGAMSITQTPEHDPAAGVHAVAAALDAGVTLFDTADSYGPTSDMGVNETALIRALEQIPGALDRAIVATKGGHTRGPNATWWINGTPEYLAQAARASLKRLGLEALPLYQHHRPDPKVPYAESMGALRQLVDDGIAVRIGVSNVDLELLEIARSELGDALVSVQNELSPLARESLPVLQRCEELGLAFLAWGPLGGMRQAKALTAGIDAFAEVARERGVSPQRVAIAWLLSLSSALIPIPGASRPESITDSAAAATLELSAAELQLLTEAV